ncbi:calcium-binding protein [Symbioplanes lichenis]|uniref:calcium-binding protein n=1 Tax=Symbioplanes lichenis TaxID=1629072 RepID=UPI002739BFBC|nr:calcium-binding protein [Actinoplanes lichenis]
MRRDGWMMRAGALVLASAGAGAVLAGPAEAAPATGVAGAYESNGIFWYRATLAKAHKVVITRSGNTITFDDVTPIKAGQNCKAVKGDKTRVRCTLTKVSWVSVSLGNKNDTLVNKTAVTSGVYGQAGNDTLTGGSGGDTFYGGAGNDTLAGGTGGDHLYGEAGNDTLRGGSAYDYLAGGPGADKIYGGDGGDTVLGGSGNDLLYGENGNDQLWGESGSDKVYGGAGDDNLDERLVANSADLLDGGAGSHDLVNYSGRQQSVRVDLGSTGSVNGESGERDTVRNVEDAAGGFRGDILIGSGANNSLRGNGGDDLIHGRSGDDHLEGGLGSDQIFGEAGDDTLSGLDVDSSTVAQTPDLLDGGDNGTLGDLAYVGPGDTAVDIER